MGDAKWCQRRSNRPEEHMFWFGSGNDKPADADISTRQHSQTSREVEGLRRLREHKSIPHGFRDALGTVAVAAAIVTPGADVDILFGRQAQTGQRPVAARGRAVTEGSVVHVV